ncbi:N-acetylmuramoyl-L-alanine amidase [Streptococcus sp. DD12]|nr:N-acetylmuramoyl-L-alanine amidase [Streptococcus sp. DD12]
MALAVLLIGLPLILTSQPPHATQVVHAKENPQRFIQQVAPHAQLLSKAYGIKASLLIGQAALSSNYGGTLLASKYHNLYGMTTSRNPHAVLLLQSVYQNNRWTSRPNYYTVYASWQDSMDAYMDALKSGQWGDSLYTNLVTHKSNDEAAQFLAASSYTTDPDYTNKLTNIISRYRLTQYDN